MRPKSLLLEIFLIKQLGKIKIKLFICLILQLPVIINFKLASKFMNDSKKLNLFFVSITSLFDDEVASLHHGIVTVAAKGMDD